MCSGGVLRHLRPLFVDCIAPLRGSAGVGVRCDGVTDAASPWPFLRLQRYHAAWRGGHVHWAVANRKSFRCRAVRTAPLVF